MTKLAKRITYSRDYVILESVKNRFWIGRNHYGAVTTAIRRSRRMKSDQVKVMTYKRKKRKLRR